MGVANPGMFVYASDVSCVRISSVASLDQSDDIVEIGWRDADTGFDNCHTIGDEKPHLFRVWMRSGTYRCDEFLELTPSVSYGFGVADQNGDTIWTYTWQGAAIDTVDNTFTLGASLTNGERHNTSESAKALFDGTRYMATDGWHAWSQSKCDSSSDDPGYNNQLLSATKVQVTTAAPQC